MGIVYMDEPTSGMDVATRQNLWQLTFDILESRECCVVLTTHSMEEAEKLATRIAIIVDGALVAIGTPQHLKSKFGSGVRLEVIHRLCATTSTSTYCVSRSD